MKDDDMQSTINNFIFFSVNILLNIFCLFLLQVSHSLRQLTFRQKSIKTRTFLDSFLIVFYLNLYFLIFFLIGSDNKHLISAQNIFHLQNRKYYYYFFYFQGFINFMGLNLTLLEACELDFEEFSNAQVITHTLVILDQNIPKFGLKKWFKRAQKSPLGEFTSEKKLQILANRTQRQLKI